MKNVEFLNIHSYVLNSENSLNNKSMQNIKDKEEYNFILPYKLLKSDVILQERDPEFINRNKPKIQEFINRLLESSK